MFVWKIGMKYAVIYRAHYWDADVEDNYLRTVENSPGADVFIARDTTNGACVIPHAEDRLIFDIDIYKTEEMGFPTERGFHYNGDYATLCFFKEFPDYDYYITIECDLAVFYDLSAIVEDMAANKIDNVCYEQPVDSKEWYHVAQNGGYEDNKTVMPAWICVHFLSRKALVGLMVSRYQHALLKVKNNLEHWPYCEYMMGSIHKIHNLKFKDLRSYCDQLKYYHWRYAITEKAISRMDEVYKKNTFIHPVSNINKALNTSFFGIDRMNLFINDRMALVNDIRYYSKAYYLENNSEKDREDILNCIRENIDRSEGDYDYLFEDLLSLDAKASQSSINDDARSPDEAQHALKRLPSFDFAFHTHLEASPWWKMEFNENKFVRKLYFFDWVEYSRTSNFYVMIGKDEDNLRLIWRNYDRRSIGNIETGPLVIPVNEEIKIVKVGLAEHGILSLDAVMAI